MADVRIGGVYATFRAKNDPFLRASRQNVKALQRQGKAVRDLRKNSRQLRDTTERLNRSLQANAKRVAQAAVIGLGFAVRSFANLEHTLASVRGITGATEKQFETLAEQVRRLGRTTKFTAQQAAEGQLFLARAGFKVNEIFAALPGTLQLAQAASVELGEAADIVSNVLASFGAGADETIRFADVLAKTTTSANTDLLQLADAIKLVGPISLSLGVSLETTAAAIGMLSNAGLQATLAGTGLRSVLFSLEAPTSAVLAILHDLELRTNDVSISQNGLIKVLEKLRDSGISAGQAIQLFGKRGAPAFNVLINSIPKLRELEITLLNSAGTAAELARIQDDTLTGSFYRLVSAADGFGESLVRVSGLGAGVKSAFESLANSINRLTDYIAQNSKRIFAQVRLAAELFFGVFLIVGPLGRSIINIAVMAKSVGALTFALGLAASAAKFLGKALFIVAIVEGFLLVIDAVRAAKNSFGSLADFADFLELQYLDAFSSMINAIEKARDSIENFLSGPGKVQLTLPIDLASLFFTPERQAELRGMGRKAGELFEDALRLKLSLVTFKQDIEVKPKFELLPFPPAIVVKPLSFPPDTAKAQRQQTAYLVSTLDLEKQITRQIEDTARQRERGLEISGLLGEELLVARARQDVLAMFEDERLRIARNLLDVTSNVNRAADAEQRALLANNAELEKSAKRARISAEKRQQILQLDLKLLDQQIQRADKLADIAEREARAQAAAERAAANFEKVREVVESVGESFSKFATDAILNFKDIGSAARSLGQAIVKDLIEVLITAQIRKAALGLIGGLIPGFAAQSGGVHSGFGLVGEGGPELVDFRRPGRVYTNEELGAALTGSGGAPVFNFSPIIQSSDGPAVRRAVLESFPVFEERVLRHFASDMRRPSALRTVTRR